jgi:hypothetical protein
MIVLGVVLLGISFFGLGRLSAQREINEMRADIEVWTALATEIHGENYDMRLNARGSRS